MLDQVLVIRLLNRWKNSRRDECLLSITLVYHSVWVELLMVLSVVQLDLSGGLQLIHGDCVPATVWPEYV